MTTVDRELNLVIPIDRGEAKLYCYSTPIRRETFEFYYLVISKAFSKLYAERLHVFAGPKVMPMVLKDVATSTARDGDRNWWEGPDGVELGLVGEFRRRTTVLAPKVDGTWDQQPLEAAKNQGLISADEAAEVEAAVAFFMVNSAMHKRSVLMPILTSAAGMWGWEVTSSPFSAWRDGLPTLTPAAATSRRATPSTIPT